MLTDASCVMRGCIGSFVIYFISVSVYALVFHAPFYNLQFAAVVVHLFLCRHYFVRFYQIVSMDARMAADCL